MKYPFDTERTQSCSYFSSSPVFRYGAHIQVLIGLALMAVGIAATYQLVPLIVGALFVAWGIASGIRYSRRHN